MINIFYKRCLICLFAFVFLCFACACVPRQDLSDNPIGVAESGLYVHFLDVGQGDAILINLPDGKNMMIDTGDRIKKVNDSVKDYLKANSVTKIDYLVLTHPDSDHVGGAKDILENFTVDKVYLPKPVFDAELFSYYNEALEVIESKNIQTDVGRSYLYIKGNDYEIAFLSPLYDGVPRSKVLTEQEINDLSCVIYLEYRGVRFLFTGDAGSEREKAIVEEYTIGLFDIAFERFGITVELDDVDFLKVSHHGARDATCADFIGLLRPNNAVISVSGDNNFGHPNTEVLTRILNANQNCKLWRTDVCGTITAHVSTTGKIQVIT